MMNKPDVDVDSIITQLLSVKDQPGKQVGVLDFKIDDKHYNRPQKKKLIVLNK